MKLLVFLALVTVARGYMHFQTEIPNGEYVRNPCGKGPQGLNGIWPGVGHINLRGTGDRNPFGIDWAAAKFMWTKTLCEKDSDGDGKTNGQELGDPRCVWSAGQTEARLTRITHPGICDPVASRKCRRQNKNPCHNDNIGL